MNIDKFGRHQQRKTDDQIRHVLNKFSNTISRRSRRHNFDVNYAKIENVLPGESSNDVVVLKQLESVDKNIKSDYSVKINAVDKFLKSQIDLCLKKKSSLGTDFNANKFKIINVEKGQAANDVIVFEQLESTEARINKKFETTEANLTKKFNSALSESSSWPNNYDAKKKKLTNMSPGSEANDAIIFKQLNDVFNTLDKKIGSGLLNFNASNNRLTNLAPAQAPSDAVVYDQLKSLEKVVTDNFNASLKQIKTLLQNVLSLNNKSNFDAQKKIIENVAEGQNLDDAINLQQLVHQINALKTSLTNSGLHLNSIQEYDAKKRIITNVQSGVGPTDVANCEQLQSTFATLENRLNQCLMKNNKNLFDVKNSRIINLLSPIHSKDAVSLGFLTRYISKQLNSSYFLFSLNITGVLNLSYASGSSSLLPFTLYPNNSFEFKNVVEGKIEHFIIWPIDTTIELNGNSYTTPDEKKTLIGKELHRDDMFRFLLPLASTTIPANMNLHLNIIVKCKVLT